MKNQLFFFLTIVLSLGLCLSGCGDPCKDVACLNGGSCVEGDCVCPTGYSGINCETEDLCITNSIICQNGGTCVNGVCDCPTGYIGNNCESFDPTQVQALLTAGVTPIDLYNSGIPVTALYGKTYRGGLIFYLNTVSGDGLVSATSNVSGSGDWGCYGTNTGVWNVTSNPPASGQETATAAKIGAGANNTDEILAACSESSSAAARCRAAGSAWFLPSRGELNLMYTNLHLNGFGNFDNYYYWSSTEYSSERAWDQNFSGGNQANYSKNDGDYVRAAKAF